jgi:tRNA pseudouridine55 synthase
MTPGFILLDKPKGLSSQQAIYHLRKKLALPKTIKIGHGGTLDPLATGMLVMALGSATKFLGYLLNANKTYEVTAKLGQVTSTFDAEGEILSETLVPELNETQILEAFKQFTGPIEQIPPMYSALKFQGKPLYHYARKGQDIIRPPRAVHIYDLILQSREKDSLSFISQVSKGTYIRSLVHDIGQLLGCGAHVSLLHRSQVDPFQASEMVTIDQLAPEALRPIETLFMDLESIVLNAAEIKKLKSGQKLNEKQFPILKTLNNPEINSFFRAYQEEGNAFIGLLKLDEERRIMGEKWV